MFPSKAHAAFLARQNVRVNTAGVNSPNRLVEAEKHARLVLNGISVLRQISEHFDLPAAPPILEELAALGRAQRRALKAAHLQLESDPLLAHLLKSRLSYRHADKRSGKSTKRIEEVVCSTFYIAQSLHYRGDIHDWRKLLAIFPQLI